MESGRTMYNQTRRRQRIKELLVGNNQRKKVKLYKISQQYHKDPQEHLLINLPTNKLHIIWLTHIKTHQASTTFLIIITYQYKTNVKKTIRIKIKIPIIIINI